LVGLLAWAVVEAQGPAASDRIEDAAFDAFDLEEQIARVSDGDLRFLAEAPERAVHRHINRIDIDEESLRDGWVALAQCHEHLDAVPRAEIVYRADGIRGLVVREAKNIGQARVEGNTVQLTDVQPDARLCITAESQALRALGDSIYRLQNGPFMRRFLDGYYPMEVQLEVRYPEEALDLVATSPSGEAGVLLTKGDGELSLSLRFEGRLYTCLDFAETGAEYWPQPCGDQER
jgi:hypothetical protein